MTNLLSPLPLQVGCAHPALDLKRCSVNSQLVGKIVHVWCRFWVESYEARGLFRELSEVGHSPAHDLSLELEIRGPIVRVWGLGLLRFRT